MAAKVELAVTQAWYDADGNVGYDVGHRFPLDADLPDGIRVTPVIVDVGTDAAQPADAEPPKDPAPVPAAKPAPVAPAGKSGT